MRQLLMATIFGAVIACFGAVAAAADAPTLASAPPVVVKTEPQAGTSDVSASLTEIRVTFSKPMRDKSWSWVMVTPDAFPKMTGDPHFSADMTTCVLPIALAPGKTYAIWINATTGQNFQDADGHKAVPYLLMFSTK
ncbi:MAG TPA: Ig-like domain-containing protein [Stellaceae bacterium]|nr:Ig-like domain-containing protein [Stellaceae bacterium]